MTSRKFLALSPVLFAAQLLCLLFGTHAASVLQAYRLVQYDREGVPSGSRAVRLAQYATLKKEGANLFRSVVLLPFKEATLQLVKELLDPATGVAGLMFLLPKPEATLDFMDDVEMELQAELEKFLILQAIAIPVYFIEESEELKEIVPPPSAVPSVGEFCRGSLRSKAAPLKQPVVVNYEGWLSGSDGGKPGRPASPTIMICAHYDDFSLAPGKPGGGNGSGVVTVMSLIRLFGSLYSNPATRPQLNLLFLLTGGGGMDSMGLRHWIKSAETRLLDSIEFVISLDMLSGWKTDRKLHFHYSKPPKEPLVTQWYRRFEAAAEMEGVTLQMSHKKINLALPYKAWEHEHLAQHKMLGATLSGWKESGNPMFRSSVLDRPSAVDRETLANAIKIVGNAISMRLYEKEGRAFPAFGNLSAAVPGLEPRSLHKWMASMGQVPKMAPFFSQEDAFGTSLLRFLKQHTDRATASSFRLEPEFVVYDGIFFEVGVYETAGVLFDILLLVAVVSYLVLLFAGLKIVTQGWCSFIALFNPPPQKWKKGSGAGRSLAQRLVGSGKK